MQAISNNLDVKLVLSVPGANTPVAKRVPSNMNFAALMTKAKALAAKHNMLDDKDPVITYKDEDGDEIMEVGEAVQEVVMKAQCQQEDWPTHRHICPHPPPMEWFTASTTNTTTGQQPPEIIEDKSMESELKMLEQIQEDLKICQKRLDRFVESSRETTLSPVRIKQENPAIPDNPSQSLESPDIIVNPLERPAIPDSSISTKPQESSESSSKPLESSNNPLSTRAPDNTIMTKSPLSPAPQLKMTVKIAKLSRELPGQIVEKKRLYEVIPLEHFESLSEFSIRLKIQVKLNNKRVLQ